MDEIIGGFVIIYRDSNIIAINPKAVRDMLWNRNFKRAQIYTSGDNYYSVPCDTEQDFIDLIKKFEVEGREE